MTNFEKAYERLFMLRGVDTKHMNDCELVWRAAQADHEAALKAAALGHARYEYVRTLNPHQFTALVLENINTGVAFDALVDQARGAK